MRTLPILALAGCGVDYSCADVAFYGRAAGEWCGPLGSFGFDHVDDGMVHLHLTPEADGGAWSEVLDWLPGFGLSFRRDHLREGAELGAAELNGFCSRIYVTPPSQNPYEGGYTTWLGPVATLRIHGPSSRTATGGPAWRMSWDVSCPGDADMLSVGSDVIELSPTTEPFDHELYGFPPDYEFVE